MHYESLRQLLSSLSSLILLPFSLPRLRTYNTMSRRTDYSTLPTGEQSLQDEEAISATGEGDEEMEDAEEQEEGYSTYTWSRTPSMCSQHLTRIIISTAFCST